MATVAIKYCDIPACLHKGQFYRSLDSDDPDGIIEIPSDCFAMTMKAKPNLKEFRQLVRIKIFWMLDEYPAGVQNFCSRNDFYTWQTAVARDLPKDISAQFLAPLMTAYSDWNGVPLANIVQSENWQLIKHAISRVSKNSDATAVAAGIGNLTLLRLLYEEGFSWHEDTCYNAATTGHLECLQYAYANGSPLNRDVFATAAAKGHTLCMEFAHTNGIDWHPETCMFATMFGHLQCLKYALDHGCPCDAAENVNKACSGGHLACLILLHERGATFSEDTAYHASRCHNLACLEYLRQNGCPWDERVTSESARRGFVRSLVFAFDNGCPHEDKLMCSAAASGNIDCFRYLVEDQGLYMDEQVFIAALLKGNLVCLHYIIDQGCPYSTASFNEADYGWYDTLYVKDTESFLRCVDYAMERGWSPNNAYYNYLSTRNSEHRQKVVGELPVLSYVFAFILTMGLVFILMVSIDYVTSGWPLYVKGMAWYAVGLCMAAFRYQSDLVYLILRNIPRRLPITGSTFYARPTLAR